ncbi:MAG TPA: hypothetical protein VK737_10640 [Opitutales bacterium]|nr:hypothetical protein [Opitutales bacterium]
MTAALGFTLVLAGLITHPLVSVFGAVALVMGLIGWFRAVLPREAHEAVPVEREVGAALKAGREVRHLQVGEQRHRARLPLEVYPYPAGIRGGMVGGAAMALLAVLYGLIGHKSIWYPINLLAAAGSAKLSAMSYQELLAFSGTGLVLASVIHIAASALVGLLYSVLLPIFPRRPILVGGIIAPLLWSGLLYSTQSIINPTLNARIDWPWFMAFQFVFGVVAGLVVARHERVFTLQYLPVAVRLRVEAPGFMGEKNGEEPKP